MNDRINTSQWQRLGELFEQAIGLDSAGQAELLRSIEREDAELARALASLLAADARHGDRTSEQRERVLHDSLAIIDASDVAVGDRIGPYILREELGRGGMGVVFRAERADGQVRQEVALKVVKLGMDTREVIARFEAERQALALMDHPHIARMLDAGATASGRPYFVMELVNGEPISSYCSKHGLAITQRLQLFDQVCTAVQHAHTKGIIHRDLKPNNVLVSAQDGQPFAKVIDFGIAKATSGRLTDKTLLTEQFLMMGTPLYMSPEQAAGSADIDTRTDIYALGVILYELLTDTTPIDSNSLRTAAREEVQRIIREVDPPRPSVRLSESITSKTGAAGKSGMESRISAGMVRGDLDWIAMKAIEKDRARRYETANALALDVRRHLAGEAVLAAPPSAVYRMRKFVNRHSGATAVGLLIAGALLFGIQSYARQARFAQQQAQQAEHKAVVLKMIEKYQEDVLKRVSPTRAGQLLTEDMQAKLLMALVKAGVPREQRMAQAAVLAGLLQRVNAADTARDLIVRTTLDTQSTVIRQQFTNQPVVAASLRQMLADRYVEMGLYDAAMPLQQTALATRRRVLGLQHRDTLQSISDMGELLLRQGKPSEAEPFLREALEQRRLVLGQRDSDTVQSIRNMGGFLESQNKLDEAESYFREALEISHLANGEDREAEQGPIGDIGVLLTNEGKFVEAEPYLRKAVETLRSVFVSADDPGKPVLIGELGMALQLQGKLNEAEPYLREALDASRRDFGEDHPATLDAIATMGNLLQAQGKLSEAEGYLREVLEKRRRIQGEQAPDTLLAVYDLGVNQLEQGKLSEAEPYLREAVNKMPDVLGKRSLYTLGAIGQFSALLVAQGKYAEVEKLLAPIVEARWAIKYDYVYAYAQILVNLGDARTRLGEFGYAEIDLLAAHPALLKIEGPKNITTRKCTEALVDLYTSWNIAEPGKGYDAKAAGWKRKLDEPDAPTPAPVDY